MIDLSSINNIYLFAGAADFRKGIVGLSGLILVSYPNITDRLVSFVIQQEIKSKYYILMKQVYGYIKKD